MYKTSENRETYDSPIMKPRPLQLSSKEVLTKTYISIKKKLLRKFSLKKIKKRKKEERIGIKVQPKRATLYKRHVPAGILFKLLYVPYISVVFFYRKTTVTSKQNFWSL